MKKLDNFTLFIAGDPSLSFPERAFATYDVVQQGGLGRKSNQVHEIVDPDPSQNFVDLWNETLDTVKAKEGITG